MCHLKNAMGYNYKLHRLNSDELTLLITYANNVLNCVTGYVTDYFYVTFP